MLFQKWCFIMIWSMLNRCQIHEQQYSIKPLNQNCRYWLTKKRISHSYRIKSLFYSIRLIWHTNTACSFNKDVLQNCASKWYTGNFFWNIFSYTYSPFYNNLFAANWIPLCCCFLIALGPPFRFIHSNSLGSPCFNTFILGSHGYISIMSWATHLYLRHSQIKPADSRGRRPV